MRSSPTNSIGVDEDELSEALIDRQWAEIGCDMLDGRVHRSKSSLRSIHLNLSRSNAFAASLVMSCSYQSSGG